MTDVHAKLSPSGAHRWLYCPGSAALEAEVPDVSSIYADEGTAAHTLASTCLTAICNPAIHIGTKIAVGEREFEVTKDMAGYVQTYVDLVRQLAEGHTLLVEKRVPIHHMTGEADAEGTSDATILNANEGVLINIDFKYGRGVEVSAENHEQSMMYALGALEKYSVLADFHTVLMVISQPRVSDKPSMWSIPSADLLRFAEVAAAGADTCRAAEAARANPGIDESAWAEAYLRPAEKACRFCNAKATCPALRDEVSEMVGETATAADFAALAPTEVTEQTGDNYLSIAMTKVGLVEDWCKAIRAEVERRLLQGAKVDGWKLVAGRAGNRAWRDETETEALFKSFRLKIDQMYDFKLISPTKAEKLLKDNPKRWNKAKGLITRSEGKPSVAPATDPRPEVTGAASADDFGQFVNAE